MRLRVLEQETTEFVLPMDTIVVHTENDISIDIDEAWLMGKDNVVQLRPPTRGHCENGIRPCPFVMCRYNLYLDVRGDGVLRVNFPNLEPDEMIASCALDMAEDGPRTLDQVAGLMGMSKERARQIEASALVKLREALGADELLDDPTMDRLDE
jgi:hypothetical protein